MTSRSIADMRISYTLNTLGDREVLRDPIAQFDLWFQEELEAGGVIEPNAMTVATVDEHNVPQARTVLLKSFDAEGLVFYTNLESAKGQAINRNPNVAALFYWPTLQRQVRWTGIAARVSDEQSDEYFASRPRGSQIGAWASDQSRPVSSSVELHRRFDELEQSFAGDEHIVRPPYWGGIRIRPTRIEFWQGRENRMHDRILYQRSDDGAWTITRLAP